MKVCEGCQRYLKNEETACPFCGSTALFFDAKGPRLPAGASRARTFASRAAVASLAVGVAAACNAKTDDTDSMTASGGTENGSGGVAASGGAASGGAATASGGGLMIASGGESTAGGGAAGESAGGEGGLDIAIYGGPFPDMARARV